MCTEWSVRPATVDDAPAITEIVMETRSHPSGLSASAEDRWRAEFLAWTTEIIEAADPGNVLSVIEGNGQPIGRLRVVRDTIDDPNLRRTPRIQLAGIQLLPHRQGHGIGTKIIRDLQREAVRDRIPLDIGVGKDNPRARRLVSRRSVRRPTVPTSDATDVAERAV